MNKEQALKILNAVPVTSGCTYDLLQHFITSVDEPDGDEDITPPSSAEAGDLFRVLMLEERYFMGDAEEVYDAAMEIVNCANIANRKLAS